MSNEFSDREIKQAVVDNYGARARNALESVGVSSAAVDACCSPAGEASADAPQSLEFVELGSATAGHADGHADACACATVGEAETDSSEYGATLYPQADIDEVPPAAQLASAGCGNPVAIAELGKGEAVLDLGSGGGIDCFLAAKQVGDEGEVWGADMTPDMVQLARHNAEQVDAKNVNFRLGEIEDIPFTDEHFDAVISNCVINLSPDKSKVFAEAFRVLKPGGRLRVSDIVITRDLPEETKRDLEQWAGCVAGALPVDDYLGQIREAGFTDVSAEFHDGEDRGIASAYVSATRPA